MNSNVPITDKVIAYCHKTMPIKVRILSSIDFLDKKKFKSFTKDVFLSNDVSHATSYIILKLSNLHNLKNDVI